MYLTIVTFHGAPVDPAAAAPLIRAAAPAYRAVPGLVRKYFTAPEGARGGGVYEWTDEAAARAWWTPERIADLEARHGVSLELTHCALPALVDNASGAILYDEVTSAASED